MTPVLATSSERRIWAVGRRIGPTLADHAAAVRIVGPAVDVGVADPNADSIRLYEAQGPNRAPGTFNDGGRGNIHHRSNYGPWLLARAVVGALPDNALGRHVRRDLPSFDPTHPPLRTAVTMAPSTSHDRMRPDGD